MGSGCFSWHKEAKNIYNKTRAHKNTELHNKMWVFFFTSISHSLALLWPDQQHQCIFAFSLNRRTVQNMCVFTPPFFCSLCSSFYLHIYDENNDKNTNKIADFWNLFYVCALVVCFFSKLLVFSFQCVHKMLFTLCKHFVFYSTNALFLLPFRAVPIHAEARCVFVVFVLSHSFYMFYLYIAVDFAFEYAIIKIAIHKF